ncbi:hypothetical protein DCO58_08905 [Helicobacter saguini]|uniref:Uncharacterized protein n=1 Tax=Helicobacter saguini TaxID=1548018 RepID=A0A347VP05_9HELI|nr:hypothetical protein [Helicobacter saguini]MWV61561.1 hypothetical protein [Helicobacter saguini]MWV67769.1 hypothetical protein [Helicobacter saguini]MWV70763.1 hypothetical protein [Helicobacter saguini]MWV72667.1 hypothetical protein [Helicobacter saguini]TLD94530.1 hypothetical protein LS64_005005 [Helicobacter saguini]
MKIVIYSQQGGDTLSGVHTDISFDFNSFKHSILIKTETNDVAHFISCRDIESIGIWRTSELECAFISACKNGRPLFMIVPDSHEEAELQIILSKCIEKIQD